MADNTYQRAIKPLTFGIVTKKSPVKADTFSLVRDVKKLQYTIQLPTFQLEPAAQTVRNLYVRWAGQYNFSVGRTFRILNYSELRNLPSYSYYTDYTNALISIRFRQNGELVRYKLAGYYQMIIRYWLNAEFTVYTDRVVPSDIGLFSISGGTGAQFNYRSFLPERWYNGELIESDFALEVWKVRANASRPAENLLDMKMFTSKLKVPDSLTETNPLFTYTQAFDRTSAGIAFNQAFPVAIPQGLNS